MSVRKERRSYWTWGYVSDEPSEKARVAAAKNLSARIGKNVPPPAIVPLDEIELRPPRVVIPSRLKGWVNNDHDDRVTHTNGGHPVELLRAMRGEFCNPPDAVAHPRTETELEATLDWCDGQGIIAIPFGGGTSVVWGVSVPESASKAVTIDLDNMNSVMEVDDVSLAGRFQAGILGPDLEANLKPLGLTLRHYPQSFPWSTVGGWIATRSGGHYATNHTHIDDFVESTRTLSPKGWLETRRLPGSGAGPSPDRMIIGSEGIFGIITESWLRLQRRPVYRATAGVLFPSWDSGAVAVRHIIQAKLWPANLRILDPIEAANNANLDGKQSLLIIGFESSQIPQEAQIRSAVQIARDFGGLVKDDDILIEDGTGKSTGHRGSVGAWRNAFIGVNAGLTAGLGLLADTFETSITWDRWPEFDEIIRSRVGKALKDTMGDTAIMGCRFTHVYPDGPAPYYSFSGVVPIGAEEEIWKIIKEEANHAIIDGGGTITHHHAVGRMHAPSYGEQRPPLFGDSLRAIKRTLDPNGILNPGVLID